MIDIFTDLALAGAAISTAACLVVVHGRRIAAALDGISRLPRAHLAAFLFFAAIATLSAQKTNSPPRMMMGHPLAMQQVLTVSPNDVSRGFRLESETSVAAHSYAMPANGVRYENRHLVGVREIVNCYAYPHVGQWGETGGGELVFRLGVQNYTCPLVSDGSMLFYSLGGSRHDFGLTIVEPSAIVGEPQFAYNFGVATNRTGGAGMRLQLYVLPDTVSFEGIAMEEVPSVSKFQHAVSRGTNNVIRLDGIVQEQSQLQQWGSVNDD